MCVYDADGGICRCVDVNESVYKYIRKDSIGCF